MNVLRAPKGFFPIDGAIKRLREAKQWPQKELAAQANLDLRTIQRAEASRTRIQRGALQSIAAALGTDVTELVTIEDTTIARQPRHEIVRLVQAKGAESIVSTLSVVGELSYRLEADPADRQQADKLARAIEIVDLLKKVVEVFSETEMSLADQIRLRGELNELLQQLEECGIHLYCGRYTCRDTDLEVLNSSGVVVRFVKPQARHIGVIVVSREQTRTISAQCYGMSDTEQAQSLVSYVRSGASVKWPRFGFEKLKRQVEEILGLTGLTEENVPF